MNSKQMNFKPKFALLVEEDSNMLLEIEHQLSKRGIQVLMVHSYDTARRVLGMDLPYKGYDCKECDSEFKSLLSLLEHPCMLKSSTPTLLCPVCQSEFVGIKNLKFHRRSTKSTCYCPELTCAQCNKSFKNQRSIGNHQKQHINQEKAALTENLEEKNTNLEEALLSAIGSPSVIVTGVTSLEFLNEATNQPAAVVPPIIVMLPNDCVGKEEYIKSGARDVFNLPLEDDQVQRINKIMSPLENS